MRRRVLAILTRAVPLCAVATGGGGGCLDVVVGVAEHNDQVDRARARQARVELAGAVHDEQGRPLRGVRVTQSRRYFVVDGLGAFAEMQPREQARTRTVNGEFRFRWSEANAVRLLFEKDGYAPAELDIRVAEEEVPVGSPPAAPVVRTGVVVTLRREM